MVVDSQFRFWIMAAIAAAAPTLGACRATYTGDDVDAASPGDEVGDDPTADPSVAYRRQPPPPPRVDAGIPRLDASVPIDPGTPGMVSCYSSFNPATMCAQPTHCCFSNYSVGHDGECTQAVCGWGTISCDGPEDCASGQHCCAHALIDPEDGMLGYTLACQSAACGAAPINQELCHPNSGSCGAGRTCISAYGNDTDLPRTLYICK